MSSEVRTATYTVTQALRGGAFGPALYRALQGITCDQKQSNGLYAETPLCWWAEGRVMYFHIVTSNNGQGEAWEE